MIAELHDADPANITLLRGVKWSADHLDLVREFVTLDRLLVPAT